MTTQIAVRIPDGQLGQLDEAVEHGEFESRADGVRRALAGLLAELRERRIAREYREAYGRQPDSADAGRVGAALLADAVGREESESR
ncbi:MAG: ribbon-helix-helix domain-containing protein [Solirubrobacterales bacterium]